MPPHVARPHLVLAADLSARRRDLVRVELPVTCDGSSHHLRFDGAQFYAPDHDEAGEAALRALGGAEPTCVRLVAAASSARSAELWSTLDGRASATSEVVALLRLLPAHVRRVLLAERLAAEFTDAAPVVRDRVAQLALALLGDGAVAVDALRTRFQLTREFPRFDPGPGPWSDKELVLLARCMRGAPREERPHLVLLPSDPLARQAVAKYAVALLDAERFLTVVELGSVLAPTHRNVKALTALLVAEGRLVESGGQYRVRAPAQRPTAARRARKP